jgi:hypothetical protein
MTRSTCEITDRASIILLFERNSGAAGSRNDNNNDDDDRLRLKLERDLVPSPGSRVLLSFWGARSALSPRRVDDWRRPLSGRARPDDYPIRACVF